MKRPFFPFFRWCFLLVAACSLLLLACWLGRSSVRAYLYSVTGEEDTWEQIKGLGRLIVLQLTNPPLHLEPYAPIAYTGVNPFGVNTFLEQEVEPAKVELALRMIHEAGFRWIRQEFPWEDIEQSARGDFWDHKWNKSAWEKYDRIVELANRYGLQIIARLGNPPAWSRADGDARGTFAPPDDFEDFGNFVYTIVSRYRGKVKYYQIWNEPNIYPEWGEQPVDAAGYVRLLQIAYCRAKEADPECVILSAGLAQTVETGPKNLSDLIYLQQMYDAGVKGYFDIMGVMAYGLWTGPGDHRTSPELTNFSRPQLIRDIMVRNGDADKPLWATEVGWNAVPADFPAFPLYGRVSLEQQARYAVQAYQRAQEEWPWMGVLNYWFFKRATDTETDQVFYYFRMVEPDFTPLPVYEAMKEYANQPPHVYMGYHQEDHWALEWEGDWSRVEDEQAVLGALNRSQKPGDALRFTFVGTELELVVHKSPQGGRLQVSVDGNPLREIVLHSDSSAYGVHIPLVQGLRYAPHQVEMVTSGVPGTQVDVDGLLVRRP
ncbi:MAG: cellulase family glycosylhydrolase [Chloroflexi bacterium]|nr:cellulase family glycosylhydrolase [Chloroflexota bacterium]